MCVCLDFIFRRACASLEKEYVNWLDEYRTRHVDRLNENQDKDKNDDEDIDKDEVHLQIYIINKILPNQFKKI